LTVSYICQSCQCVVHLNGSGLPPRNGRCVSCAWLHEETRDPVALRLALHQSFVDRAFTWDRPGMFATWSDAAVPLGRLVIMGAFSWAIVAGLVWLIWQSL